MEPENPAEECVVVVCPTCRARLNPRRALLGKRVRCPDCGAAVRVIDKVPQDAYVLERDATANSENAAGSEAAVENESAGSEYRLSGSDQPVDQPKFVKVKCGICGAVLHPRAELIGKRVRCPDCFKPVLVVEPPDAPAAKDYRVQGEYGLDAPPPENPMAAFVPKTPRDEPINEPEPLPPPAPTLWYWSGIFTFPWQQETVSHWMTLTLFAAFANGTTAYGLSVLAGMGEGGNSLASVGFSIKLAFTIALGAIAWLLMIAYASGCVVAIIRDTASGNDEVSDWHDAEFPEALGRTLEVIFPLAGAGAIGYGVYLAVLQLQANDTPQPFWGTMAGAVVALIFYPMMLLSVLETGAFWVVVSGSALRLIFGFFTGWLLINVEMGLVTGAWWLLTWGGAKFLPIITAILGAPIYAAVIMIDARLLGRFLYRANEVVSARDEAKADDDEDDDEEGDDADDD